MKFLSVLTAVEVLLWLPSVIESLNVTFDPSVVLELLVGHELNVTVSITDLMMTEQNCETTLKAEPEPVSILGAQLLCSTLICEDKEPTCNVTMTLEGLFLGLAKVKIRRNDTSQKLFFSSALDVSVLREAKTINKVFIAFVATIVSINYINMGCALDLKVVKAVLKKPIAPAVGFVCQFVVMPLVAYGVGALLFTDPILRLGLFTFGCSPGGGASNMWTVLLRGNLNLSITMTFISTIAALGTIPLWLFTLGPTIVKGTNIVIPFSNILISLVSMLIPICIGLAIQRYYPRLAAISKRILAPVCIVMIIIIIVLGTIANFYMLQMLTWQMVIGASLNVWIGFAVGAITSAIFRFPTADITAVAVETGIQNTGIAFLLLSYSLKAPISEIASVVPVAASIITPIPLFIIYCGQKFRDCCCRSKGLNFEKMPLDKSIGDNKATSGAIGLDNLAMDDKFNY